MRSSERSSAENTGLQRAARRLFSALDRRTLIARLEEAAHDLLGADLRIYAVQPEGLAALGDELMQRAAATRGYVEDPQGRRAAVSVATGGYPTHVIEIRAHSGNTFDRDDLIVLELLAEYFGVAFRNASLVTELEEWRRAILELHQVKSDLIAMLAHDFKGPLTSIVGFTELTMELGEVNPDQREYLESVKRMALRLADLATDTLAFSRLERNEIDVQLEEVDAAELVRETAESFHDQREVRVSANGRAVVHVDARRLRQVLYNLIENAIKYSSEGSPVDVKIRGNDGRFRVSVTDRGIGIPKKELKEIFGRFSRGSNARGLGISGTGFGLYLARQIVELHGGRIKVASKEGKGSTFTVDLPVKAAAPPEQFLTVAVLDGERESRSFIAHALREAGLRVHVHRSADELLAWLPDNRVDRLVIDVDDVRLTARQISALEEHRLRGGFTIVAVGIAGASLFDRAVPLGKPFLVHDLLSALGARRSRPA